MSKVSLTDLYQGFIQNCSEVNIDSEIITENSEKFLGNTIRRSLQSFSQTAVILVTLCDVYKELKDLLDHSQKNVYNFLIDYIRSTTDSLISNNRLDSLLLTKSQVSNLENEIAYIDSEQALLDAIPVHLSFLSNGKFANKYADAVKTSKKEEGTVTIQKVIASLNSKKQNAQNLLKAITDAYAFTEDSVEKLFIQQFTEKETSGEENQFLLDVDGKLNPQYLHDRVIRVFLFIESYKRLCTEDNFFNSRLLFSLMNFLQINVV